MTGTDGRRAHCRFCGAPVPRDPWDAVYRHCTGTPCVDAWRSERLEGYRLDLVPKQGFAISFAGTAVNGRSSGK